MIEIKANAIGIKALEIIRTIGGMKVLGLSSRGIFLAVEDEWVLFLTSEKFRGPLTINVPGIRVNGISIGDEVRVIQAGNDLLLQGDDLSVRCEIGHIYAPPTPALGPTDTWDSVWQRVSQNWEKLGLGKINENPRTGPGDQQLLENLRQFTESISADDLDKSLDAAGRVLGTGQGLTPEGDDFLIGILYILRVANNIGNSSFASLLKKIPEVAQRKTTRISANLIACAAEGLVDERISNYLEKLFHDPENMEQAAKDLLGWGKTSGRMVISGMITGLDLIRKRN